MPTTIRNLGECNIKSPLHQIGGVEVRYRSDAERVLYDHNCTPNQPPVTPQEIAALYQAGTNGQSFVLTLGSATVSGGNITIRWSGGVPPYTVQRKNAITDGSWTDVLTTSGNSATLPTTNTAGFFRVRNN